MAFSLFKYTTDWVYESSEEKSATVFLSYVWGRLTLKNSVDGKLMNLKYKAFALSVSKGLPIGYAEAWKSDKSGGVGPVFANKYFSSFDFPCRGWILSLGANFFGDSKTAPTGTSANIFLFGTIPFAGLRCWGNFRSTTPGGGVGGAMATFDIE